MNTPIRMQSDIYTHATHALDAFAKQDVAMAYRETLKPIATHVYPLWATCIQQHTNTLMNADGEAPEAHIMIPDTTPFRAMYEKGEPRWKSLSEATIGFANCLDITNNPATRAIEIKGEIGLD